MNEVTRVSSIFWQEQNKLLGEHQDFENFKNWKEVKEIPLYKPDDSFTFLYSQDNYELIQFSDYKKEWLEVIKLGEDKKGHTEESWNDAMGFEFYDYQTSLWIMKAFHHMLTFEHVMEKSILDYKHIVEFGAGIGETAKMIFNRGYKGSYSIVDLPNVARISKYYLSDHDVSWIETKDIEYKPDTLFIALWSLSEVAFEDRYPVADKIQGMDQLILFSNEILGMMNKEYFTYSWPILTNTFIRLRNMWFHPSDGGNNYLIARGA